MGEFLVHTNMHCFLCADQILHQYEPLKQECHQSGTGVPSFYSLAYLSNYLKIDISRLCTGKGGAPQQLLTKVKNAQLKVELCEDCSFLNENFSKLYQKLNKIEMEVESCVHRIHSKLMRAEFANVWDGSSSNFRDPHEKERQLFEGKRQIGSLIRSEMLQKCSPTVGNTLPRIKLQKLTVNQMTRRLHRIKQNSQMKFENTPEQSINSSDGAISTPVVESLQIKEEEPDLDPLQDDDMGNPHLKYEQDPLSDDDDSKYLPHPTDPLLDDEESNHLHNLSTSTMNSGNNPDTLSPKPYSIENGKFKCDSCSKLYSALLGFRRHYKSAHSKIRYKCKLCDAKFNFDTALTRHCSSVHKNIKFECEKCGKLFPRKDHLDTHFQSVHKKEKIKCRFCPALLSSKSAVRSHLNLNRCRGKISKP